MIIPWFDKMAPAIWAPGVFIFVTAFSQYTFHDIHLFACLQSSFQLGWRPMVFVPETAIAWPPARLTTIV